MLDRPESVATWSDETIRNVCRLGTILELQAYLNAGYTLQPKPMVEPPASMRQKATEICLERGITMAQFLGNQRTDELVDARTELCVWAVADLGKTYEEIGRFIKRDHSTVIYMLKRAGVHPGPRPRPVRSHCQKGHELTPDNTYVKPNGRRHCRICMTDARRKWRARCRSSI